MADLPAPVVQTREQLLLRVAGGQPEQLFLRDLIETFFRNSIVTVKRRRLNVLFNPEFVGFDRQPEFDQYIPQQGWSASPLRTVIDLPTDPYSTANGDATFEVDIGVTHNLQIGSFFYIYTRSGAPASATDTQGGFTIQGRSYTVTALTDLAGTPSTTKVIAEFYALFTATRTTPDNSGTGKSFTHDSISIPTLAYGEMYFEKGNNTLPGTLLTSTAFAMVSGSSEVTVTHVAHGFANGQAVGYWNGSNGQAVSTRGLSIYGPYTIYDVTADTYKIQVAGTATSTGTGPAFQCREIQVVYPAFVKTAVTSAPKSIIQRPRLPYLIAGRTYECGCRQLYNMGGSGGVTCKIDTALVGTGPVKVGNGAASAAASGTVDGAYDTTIVFPTGGAYFRVEFAAAATGQIRRPLNTGSAVYLRPRKVDLQIPGDSYIVDPEDATGDWAGLAGHIVTWLPTIGWHATAPRVGQQAYVEEEKGYVRYREDGTWGEVIAGVMNNPREYWDRWISPSGGPSGDSDAFTPMQYSPDDNLIVKGGLWVFSKGSFKTTEHFPLAYIRDHHPGGTGGEGFGWDVGGAIRRGGIEQGWITWAINDTAEYAFGGILTDANGVVRPWSTGGTAAVGRIYSFSMGQHATSGELVWNGRSAELNFFDNGPGGAISCATVVQDTFIRVESWKFDSNYPKSAKRTPLYFNFNGTNPLNPVSGQTGYKNVRWEALDVLLAGTPANYFVLYMEAF